MKYSIEKLDGNTTVAWNGTIEDLEGFNVKVVNLASGVSFNGKVKNGYAVAKRGHDLNQVSKALNEIK